MSELSSNLCTNVENTANVGYKRPNYVATPSTFVHLPGKVLEGTWGLPNSPSVSSAWILAHVHQTASGPQFLDFAPPSVCFATSPWALCS